MTRPLRAGELAAMADVLAAAFMGDPLYVGLAPSPRVRERWLHWIMGMFLRVSHRLGGARCLERAPAAGVVCLVPPRSGPPSLGDYVRAAPGLPPLGRGAAALVRRGAGVAKLLADVHPPTPHCYVLAVGVAPGEQGKGVGGALLRSALAFAAARGVPCYLETASPRNVALYEHLGFGVQRTLSPAGLPPLWTMLRPAPS